MIVDTGCTEHINVIESCYSLSGTTLQQDNRARLKCIYSYVKNGLPYLISFCDVLQFEKSLLYSGCMFVFFVVFLLLLLLLFFTVS